jgi:hypothetical protein
MLAPRAGDGAGDDKVAKKNAGEFSVERDQLVENVLSAGHRPVLANLCGDGGQRPRQTFLGRRTAAHTCPSVLNGVQAALLSLRGL